MTEMIQLSLIREDGGTQARAAMSADTIEDYAAAMTEGVTFPPVTLFREGAAYWLGDGFHRVSAARKAGLVAIAAEVRDGGLRDARLFAIGANASHGLRRTNQDKRMAVQMLLQDEEWSKWSDREIARLAGVTHPFVIKLRREQVVTVTTPPPQGAPPDRPGTHQDATNAPRVEPDAQTTADRRVQAPEPPAPRAPEKAQPVDSPAFEKMREELEAAKARIEELEGQIAELNTMLSDMDEAFSADRRILEAENLLEGFDKEVVRVQAMNKVLASRNNGLMVENADLLQMLKSARRKNERLEKKLKAMPADAAPQVDDDPEPGEPCMDPCDYRDEVGA